MQIDYKFIVDLARPSKTNTLLVMQNDANTRVAHFYLMNNGLKFDPTGVMSVLITAKLPTGATIVQDAEFEPELDEDGDPVLDDNDNPVLTNEIIYALPSAITESAGKTVMVITMTGAQSQLSSFEFYVNTRNELYNFDDYSDESTFSGFRDLLDRSLEALAAAEDKIDQFNPTSFPLQLVNLKTEGGEAVSYVYNTTASVQVNFAYALDRLAALEASFPAGCQTIYEGACAAGGGDIAPASSNPSDLAAFYMTVKNYWMKGNAVPADVLEDVTFTSVTGPEQTGTMPNHGVAELTAESPESPATVNDPVPYEIPYGYYAPGSTLDMRAVYLKGYLDGYDAGDAHGDAVGYARGYEEGKSFTTQIKIALSTALDNIGTTLVLDFDATKGDEAGTKPFNSWNRKGGWKVTCDPARDFNTNSDARAFDLMSITSVTQNT